VIAFLAWAIVLVLTVPTIMFVAECTAGAAPGPRRRATVGDAPPFIVLIPAHDEERGIQRTIASVQAQLRGCDGLLVIADNCSDATATIALSAGARVLIRTDRTARGKGFALAAGRDALAQAGVLPDVVIVLDADCLPEPGALPLLAAAVARDGAAVQGRYLLTGRTPVSARSGLSNFAFLIKNLVRQRGLKALGGPALLQGSGMGFPWAVFAAAPLASAAIVEDLELGLRLALGGVPVTFAQEASFWSESGPATALASQRTRWEHGSLSLVPGYLPKLAWATMRGRRELLPLLLDLTVPPVSLLILALLVALTATIGLGPFGAGFAPALCLALQGTLLAVTIMFVWHRCGRAVLPATMLVRIPAYVLWKLPIYFRLVGGRERRWVRTERE